MFLKSTAPSRYAALLMFRSGDSAPRRRGSEWRYPEQSRREGYPGSDCKQTAKSVILGAEEVPMTMTSRERLDAALNHRQPDRIPVDFNGTAVTGMHVKCVIGLREHYGLEQRLVKVHEPYQMLGWVDDDLQQVLGIDVQGPYGPETMFGYRNENWTPWRMDDGTEVLMSGNFRTTKDANGDTLVYPGGDRTAPPSGRLPKNGFFFDTIIRQEPVDDATLDPEDNLQEFGPVSEAALDHFEAESGRAAATGRGVIATFGGTALGDIALVPAPNLKHPKG